MLTSQELARRKAEIQAQLEDCSALQAQYAQTLDAQLQASSHRYDQLAASIKQVLENIAGKRILTPFLNAFPQVMAIRNGWICISGTVVAPTAYDANTCFSVFADLEKRFISACYACFSKWESFCASPASLQYIHDIARMYNSFCSIYMAIPNMKQSALSEIRDRAAAQREAAIRQEEMLRAELLQMENQNALLAQSMMQIRQKADFSNGLPYEKDFVPDVRLPLGYSPDTNGMLEWSLSQKNGVRLIVPADRIKNDASVCRFVANTVYHFFNRYPAGATRLAIFDSCKMRQLEELPMDLVDKTNSRSVEAMTAATQYPCGEGRTYGSTEVAKAFSEVCETVENRRGMDILRFNCMHPETYQPIILFVIYGCPSSYAFQDEQANTIANARYRGAYLLIVEKEEQHPRRNTGLADLSGLEDMITLKLSSAESGNLQAECDGVLYHLATPSPQWEAPRFAAQLAERFENQRSAIALDKLFEEYKPDDIDFSKELQIPVGRRNDGSIEAFFFNSQNYNAHCAMIGTTGCGKSSLLQAIILGGASFYSPEELEFYLIDMKSGNAFYEKGRIDYSQLGHVKMIAANCSEKDLGDFIQYIVDNRMKEGTDIIKYNMGRTGSDRIRRTVIIIDEYTVITDQKTLTNLNRIAAQGRSFGISLILSSQKKGSGDLLNNIGYRLEFRSDYTGSLIELGGNNKVTASDRVFLYSNKGNCILSNKERRETTQFRAAYMDTEEQMALIQQLNARYAHIKTAPAVVFGDFRRDIASLLEAPRKTQLPAEAGAVLSVNVGKNLYGDPVCFSFGEKQTRNLLLVGDDTRAQSIEYSLLSAHKNAAKYYLDFGGRANERFAQEAILANDSDSVVEMLQEIHALYEDRKNSQWKKPVLVILHSCEKAEEVLRTREEPRQPQPQEKKPPVRTEPVQDGVSVDMPQMKPNPFMDTMLQRYTNTARFTAPRSGTQTRLDDNLCQKLRTVINSGIQQGICVIAHCNSDVIWNARDVLDNSLSNVFEESVALAAMDSKSEYAKKNLSKALQMIGATALQESIDASSFTLDERLRCHHIIRNVHKQFIAYEWEELL